MEIALLEYFTEIVAADKLYGNTYGKPLVFPHLKFREQYLSNLRKKYLTYFVVFLISFTASSVGYMYVRRKSSSHSYRQKVIKEEEEEKEKIDELVNIKQQHKKNKIRKRLPSATITVNKPTVKVKKEAKEKRPLSINLPVPPSKLQSPNPSLKKIVVLSKEFPDNSEQISSPLPSQNITSDRESDFDFEKNDKKVINNSFEEVEIKYSNEKEVINEQNNLPLPKSGNIEIPKIVKDNKKEIKKNDKKLKIEIENLNELEKNQYIKTDNIIENKTIENKVIENEYNKKIEKVNNEINNTNNDNKNEVIFGTDYDTNFNIFREIEKMSPSLENQSKRNSFNTPRKISPLLDSLHLNFDQTSDDEKETHTDYYTNQSFDSSTSPQKKSLDSFTESPLSRSTSYLSDSPKEYRNSSLNPLAKEFISTSPPLSSIQNTQSFDTLTNSYHYTDYYNGLSQPTIQYNDQIQQIYQPIYSVVSVIVRLLVLPNTVQVENPKIYIHCVKDNIEHKLRMFAENQTSYIVKFSYIKYI